MHGCVRHKIFPAKKKNMFHPFFLNLEAKCLINQPGPMRFETKLKVAIQINNDLNIRLLNLEILVVNLILKLVDNLILEIGRQFDFGSRSTI